MIIVEERWSMVIQESVLRLGDDVNSREVINLGDIQVLRKAFVGKTAELLHSSVNRMGIIDPIFIIPALMREILLVESGRRWLKLLKFCVPA